MATENTVCIGDFLIGIPFSSGFPIATFDYHRVLEVSHPPGTFPTSAPTLPSDKAPLEIGWGRLTQVLPFLVQKLVGWSPPAAGIYPLIMGHLREHC